MEIKKSNKLLKALIATSFVGVVATPIVLTSCSKKDAGTYEDQLLKEVTFKEEVKNVKEKAAQFSDFDKSYTKTLNCVVGDTETDAKKNKEYKSFTIFLTLPFDEKTKDEDKKFDFNFDDKTAVTSTGCKDKENFIVVKKEDLKDENGKVQYKFTVTVKDNVKSLVETYKDKDNKDTTDLSADKTYSTIKFTFTDKSDKNKTATFTYKITFEEKKAN